MLIHAVIHPPLPPTQVSARVATPIITQTVLLFMSVKVIRAGI